MSGMCVFQQNEKRKENFYGEIHFLLRKKSVCNQGRVCSTREGSYVLLFFCLEMFVSRY